MGTGDWKWGAKAKDNAVSPTLLHVCNRCTRTCKVAQQRDRPAGNCRFTRSFWACPNGALRTDLATTRKAFRQPNGLIFAGPMRGHPAYQTRPLRTRSPGMCLHCFAGDGHARERTLCRGLRLDPLENVLRGSVASQWQICLRWSSRCSTFSVHIQHGEPWTTKLNPGAQLEEKRPGCHAVQLARRHRAAP
jgi:hypothetical protein